MVTLVAVSVSVPRMSETDEGGTILSSTVEDEEPHAGAESLCETAVKEGRRVGVKSWACHCADCCGVIMCKMG